MVDIEDPALATKLGQSNLRLTIALQSVIGTSRRSNFNSLRLCSEKGRMPSYSIMNACRAVILLTALTGCTVSQPRPVTFVIRDAESGVPIDGAKIKAEYWSILDFGRPIAWFGPNEGVTDKDGKLTLFMDPRKDSLRLDVEAAGYHPEQHMWGENVRRRLTYGWWFGAWDEFTLAMYREPTAKAELVLPIGYRGPVVVRFADKDHPPDPPGKRTFRYAVSARGTVEIKESELLERLNGFGAISARYPGKTFRTVGRYPSDSNDPFDPPAEAAALRFVAVDWDSHVRLYVLGTKEEALAVYNLVWPDKNQFDECAFLHLVNSR
jgi:hypothetical protein